MRRSQESREQRTEQRTTQQRVTQVTSQVQGMVVQEGMITQSFPSDGAPPVFEKVFSNARFAQGGDALFEGRVTGKPRPVVTWTRKGAPLPGSHKHILKYEEQTGNVSLLIRQIGPGDEGEYTCTARNQFGEAMCSVYIQPEGLAMPVQQQGFKKESTTTQIKQMQQQTTHTGMQQQTQQTMQRTQQMQYSNGFTSIEEDFKVDTFEYRLLREVSFRESLTRRYAGESDITLTTIIDKSLGPPAPPQLQNKPRNSKLIEGSDAVFTAHIPANPRPRLTWFKNGKRVVSSQKHEISYANQQATLKVNQVTSQDSGHYTLLAENPQGCIVTSAYLAVEASPAREQHVYERETSQRLMMTQQQQQFQQQQQQMETESVEGKMIAPNFVRTCTDRDVTEGKMTRFDCRLTGRPYPEVAWFINGRQVVDDATHKILVNESGNHALMITNVSRADSGVVTCTARNKAGETSFECKLNVIEKELVVAPKFVQRFGAASVKEGEPVILTARAVGTPVPNISWQKDGVPITSGEGIIINTSSGASTLEIANCRTQDAGWYQCMAQNMAGSTATRARVHVQKIVKQDFGQPTRLHLPTPTTIIQPEPAPEPEIIYLRHVERSAPKPPRGEEERVYPPPQFIIPLTDQSQTEGNRVHFEARVEPVGDPTMQVQWYHNGKQMPASSRMTTTYRFGFIALDLLSIVPEDAGEYICVVTSATGTVQSRANLTVTSRAGIDQKSQYPDSLQYISQLEDYSKYQRTESFEEISPVKPQFIRALKDLGQLQEGRNAHFEAQLTPVSDPTMRVDWFKDGRPITASSRITTIFNFGYVSLNILHLRSEDTGVYTVRAVNRWGEAVSQSSVTVISRSSVTADLGIPEQQRYIESVEALEAYTQQSQMKRTFEKPESTSPPVFQTPIKDQLGIKEGGFAHFEARLEPVGDSTLRVEWLKDGRPVEASSRITTFFNFGYVALTIKHVAVHDTGRYTCRAYNQLGEASTSANLSVVSRQDIISDSQHVSSLHKIQHLEDSTRYMKSVQEESTVTQKPRFLGPLKGTNKIVEGQRGHFEARVEPLSDTTMKIEWYFNGKPLQTANRIQTYHDFGYVAVDIVSVRAEDSGTYTVVARNALGEAQLSERMQVETRASVDTSSLHHGVYDRTKQTTQGEHIEPQYNIEELCKSKPIFVVPLSDPAPLNEGKNIHLECRLEPMGDPTMRVEWFLNGRPVTVGSRFRTYYDFGYVAIDIIHATSADSGEYTVRATNALGSAHTSACVRVMSKSDILTETQNESSLEQIQYLEDSKYRRHVQDDVSIASPPTFTRLLHNIETLEGTNIHLECRLQPVGDPSMRVDWFVNGKPVRVGHRFRPAYDFDYVALDLLSVYPEDSGVYTCQARNQLGETVTSCSVRVIAKKDLLLESQHPGGLEKIQYLEDSSRYKRADMVDEVITTKPRFVTKPKSIDNMRERGHAHFECKLEPVTDSNLKVEWYKNGRPIIVGHRFRPIHDFGYVALDIVDVIAEDSGTYTCRAVNLIGSDETSCTLVCRGSAQIVTATQNETGLEQIQFLEDRSRYQRSEYIEETTTQAPVFTTSLKQANIKEGQRAHFECRLIPVSDNTMKVEWFHNNQPVKSGSRFTETNNFGFVALDIQHCLPEDSGTYTCRARNIVGEAITSSSLNVQTRKSIYLESQHESALSRLNQFEERRYQHPAGPDDAATQAPVFTQPMKDLRTAENNQAHFEARLIPVGDPRMKVEWLRNGVPISASNRVTTMHDFGYVALNMKYVYPEDSGTYTCRATNELGQAVTSATLFVQSKASLLTESQHEEALHKLQALEDSTKYQRTEEQEITVTQKPNFIVQLNGPSQRVEGQSAHYECRIEPYPDPNLKVEWYHNGKPLTTGHRFRTTNDFGFAALDILTVYGEDSGEYTCRVVNKLGEAQSSVKLNVQARSSIIRDTQHKEALQKIQYLEDDARYRKTTEEEIAITEKPQFGRPLKNIEHLAEGKLAHLEATLTPVNDPTMKVEWYRNGRPIPQGHRFKTTYDFGFVALDILYAYAEDSGTYMCKATNAVGEAVTTCSVIVDSKEGLQLGTMDEQRLKKIKQLEQYERPQPEEVEPICQKPVFLTPLNSLENLKEAEHAHLECRVEPINDPTMKVEWFMNGKAIKTGHRFRTTHDFGYVALDILYVYAEDSGTYMCKATNKMGEAVNTSNIKVQSRHNILLETQHPEGLEKIRELEAQGHPQRLEIEEPLPTPPRFVTELRGTTEIAEGQTAHFEAQIEPLHDPNLRVEVYHNGKPLGSASRFHITFDFGYFALDIGHCLSSDAGQYTVKAINKLGSCVSSTTLKVSEKSSIISESQRPEGLEKIKQLESMGPAQRPEIPEAVTRQRPVFTQPLQNIDAIQEAQTAHFECRLIPVGDPTLKVEWFRNEKPLEDSSRITKTHDFGYVSMDMTHVRAEDEGVYMCRASNALGEAVTTASMKIKTKASIQSETQHPEGMKKIRQLEEGREVTRPDEPEQAFDKPIFTQLLTGPSELWEGQRAHFEARVVPVGDPTMRYQWYQNGVELKMGSRFHVTQDFGFVTLDIMSTVPEDSGVYMCKAINAAGEAVSSTTLKVKPRSAISGEPIQPDAWQKIQLKEAEKSRVPEGVIETTPQMAPVFTKHLANADKLVEGSHVYLEAQVEPKADPNLRIEWFKNGKPLTTGARILTTFDFGLVTLSVNSVRPDDSAIYTCKATNLLGEAVSTCTIKVEDRHWLLGSSLRPEALPLIDALEGPKDAGRGDIPEPVYEGPVFISHLNNVVCQEGENSHFECRVEPAKDPTLNIEFFANGKPLPTGARFKGNHDFGFVTLDINGCYAEDSGIYTVKATNSKGQASTSGSLRCTGKSDIYLQTQHPQGQAGLEKVQEVESAYSDKLQRPSAAPEVPYPKPVWTTPLNPEFKLGEAQPLHLEATVEPKEDPNLKIEWFFNGKSLAHGSRFKMTSEFGFVTLDLIEVYERDQGIYTCKAWNQAGEAFTSTTIYCAGKEGLIERTQHPKGQEGLGKIQELEESLKKEMPKPSDAEEGQPPVFTSQFQNLSNLSEGDIAHFEASLTPVGDQTMVVEWFYNGKTLEASHRIRTVHAFGMVVLEILGTKIEDSGTYTCRATNKWGQAEISVTLECIDVSKGQKPTFTTQIKSVEGLKDGDSAHFECTLIPVGDPTMKVEWFHNGRPIRHSTRIKQVSDFGFVVMDIAYTQSHDSGEYVCRAKNRYGEDFTRAHVNCVGKGGVYLESLQPDSLQKIRELESAAGQQAQAPSTPITEPPKFITQIADITTLKEGQSAHFEARLTPVNDPNLVVEWYFNGKKLPHGHRYRTFHDFGIVILDILYCYAENSGVYEARATNLVGSDSTKATLKCSSKAGLILESQLPEGMEGGLEKIQNLEDAMIKTREEQISEAKGQAPVFTVPLSNIDCLREGENAHFEARLIPTNDPKLKVEWFWNNKPLRTGSRFRTFCDFGFVILEISPVYPEDSGEYSCRASNDYGQAVTTSIMKVEGKRSIIIESQLPKGMEGTIDKIAELEGLGQLLRPPVLPEDDLGKPPEFITSPNDITQVEYTLAHFECRLIPINDPSLRVEWFHNGKPLTAGSRIKTINDFGFVILEIAQIDTRDTGLYTCKATNKHGEAMVSCKLQVRGRQGIIMEPQLPNTFSSGTESIQKLEEDLHKKDEVLPEEEKPNPPRFIVELKDTESQEGGAAHFDCRVEPVGDPSLRIDWFFNGRPFATGSRVRMMNDFGFVVLDMDYTYARDTGEYICRATNKWGTATTKAKLTCKAKHDVVFDSQLPQGMSGEKLKELEKGKVTEPKPEQETPRVPPKFVTQITSATVGESEPVRFECRVEPKNDPTMRIEWYRNGKLLPSGHRYRTIFDMGFVSLDILYVYPEDAGEYVCRAVNAYGEDFTKATIACKKVPSIILQNQVPKGMKKSEQLMQMEATIKKYTSEVHLTEEDLYEPERRQPPRFVTQIQDQTNLVEMEATKFECQLAPVGDPNMKVEWFFNGKPLHHKNRFNPIYDFGYVAMNFGWVYPEDSGEYLCRATNLYGMDETKAIIRTTGKPGIIYDSQLPKGMKSIEKIREMEASWQIAPEEKIEEEKERESPVFVSKPEPVTVSEGDCARFCCRVTGFPRPRVMWLINDHTVVNGARYKLTYDGMWHLDIPKTRQYDNGKVEVVARNSSGETRVETVLNVKPRGDDYRGVLKNSPRRIVGTKEYRKPEWVTHMEDMQEKLRATQAVPTFVKEIVDNRVNFEEAVVFDCQFSGTPQPVISWYRDDKLLRASENVKIVIKDNKTSVTIKKATSEDEGDYICKAISEIGVAVTKANLRIIGYELVKEDVTEKIEEEVVEVEKKDKKKKKKKIKHVTIEEDTQRDVVDVEEVMPLETATTFVETTESATAQRTFDVQESVAVSAIASMKKVNDEQQFPVDEPQVAGVVAPIHKPVTVVETVAEHTVSEMSTKREEHRTTTSTTVTSMHSATVSRTSVQVKEIEEILETLNVKEFGPWQAPFRELAKVDILLRRGVTVNEIMSLYEADELPSLRTAGAQHAMVTLVEREGHSSLISELVTHDGTIDDTLKGVFKAFLTMVELKHCTVQQVMPLFRPRDFQTPHFEQIPTMPVIAEETATETISEIREVHVQEMKTMKKKKKKQDTETEGLPSIVQEKSAVAEVVETVDEPKKVEEIKPAVLEDKKPEEKEGKKKKVIKKKVIEEAPKQDVEEEKTSEEKTPVKPKPQKLKLTPMKVERKEMKPSTLQFAQEKVEVPLFATIKLRKASVTPKKEIEPTQLPKFLLKSRITRIEYPPSIKHIEISELTPPILDNGILSRNYEEAQKIKKKKIKKVTLPEIEKTELEQYVPYEDVVTKQLEEKQPEKIEKVPLEKPQLVEEEPKKIKLGKGKLPEVEHVQEEVKLKSIPREVEESPTEEEVKPKAVKPEKIPEKPLEDSDIPKPILPKPIDTGTPSELDHEERPTEKEQLEAIPKPEKKKKPKVKAAKPEEMPEEKELILGKPKKTSPEPPESITLKKKQGTLPPEEPEAIKLKPFTKEKPAPEPEKKEISAGKPEPFEVKREDEELEPKEFEIDDKRSKKKKKKSPKEEEPIVPQPAEETKPETKEQEKPKEKVPKPKLQVMEKVEVKVVQPKKVEVQEIKPGQPFSIKLKKVKIPEKKEEKPKEIQRILLKSRIKRIPYPPEEHKCIFTELTPPVLDNGILSRNYKEAEKVMKKKPTKVKLPRKPTKELEEVESFPEEEKLKPEKSPEVPEKLVEPKLKPEEPEEETFKLRIGKGKVPEADEEGEKIKLRKVPQKPEEPEESEDLKKKPKEEEEVKQKPEKEYPDTTMKPVDVIEFPERPSEELEKPSKPEEKEKVVPEEAPKKKTKPKKPKSKESSPEKELVLGKGKKKESPPPEEVKFRIPESKKPTEEPEEIKLKPFKKEKPEDDEKPKEEIEKKKKTIKKKKSEDTLKEATPAEPEKEKPEEKPVEETKEPIEIKKEKIKLVPQKIERKEVKATKLQMQEFTPEKPLFTTIKLRKSSVAPKQEKPQEVKKFLLKSRITRVNYPPEELKATITILPKVTVDKGVLSRNYKEAVKREKVKIKKVKLPEKEETVLEKYEPYVEEKEEPEEQPEEKVVTPRERPMAKLPDEEKPKTLEIGKGKVKQEEEAPEQITLRKVAPKVKEEEEIVETKKLPKEEEKTSKPKEKPDKTVEGISFTPVIKDEEPEKKVVEKSPSPEVIKKEPQEEVVPLRRRSKKEKKEEPVEEKKLILGKPKPQPEEEPKEFTLKKPKPKEPEEQPEEQIKLKPIKKEKEEESATETIISLKKKPQVQKVEESEAEVTMKKVETTYTEEEASDSVTIKKKPKKKPEIVKEEAAAEITIEKQVEEEVEEEIPKTVVLKKKKSLPKPILEDETVLQITFKEKPKPKPVEEEETAEVVSIKRKVSQTPKVEEVAEQFTIKKEIPEEVVQEEFTLTKTIKKPVKPIETEEVSEEITIKKVKPIPQVQEEVVAEEVVIKKAPAKKKYSVSEESGELTIKKTEERPQEEETVVESITFVPKRVKQKEEVEQEFKIKMGTYEEEEVEMSGKVTLPRKKKPSFAEEASSETIYIKQEVEAEKEIPYSVEEAEEQQVQIGLRKPKTIKKEEVEQEFKISMGKYEEEEVEMSTKIKLPKKKKLSFAEEASSETVTIFKEVEAEEGPEHVKFPLRRKSSTSQYSIEQLEEEVQLGLRKPRASVVYEEESLELKVKRKPSKPVIQSFHQEEASLEITKYVEEVKEGETVDGGVVFSICPYLAETDDAVNLVEGERVHVLDCTNPDWWFVRKHMTEEKGWIPAVYLRDEPSYTLYVQKKLHEKIDKLPIFEKPAPGSNVCAPKFVEKLQPKWAPDGASVQFQCKVEGNPRPQITWFRQTAVIKSSQDFQIFYDDNNVATLIINEVFPEDAGTFTCVAKNSAGFASSKTDLTIDFPLSDHGSDTTGLSRRSLSRESSLADILEGIPPTFSRKPKSQIVNQGSNVQLEVRLVAVPEPEVVWLRNGKPIEGATLTSDMHMYTSVLNLKKVTKRHEGIYTVIATNREGEASLKITVKVKTGDPEPPVIIEGLKDTGVTEGEGLILSVQVSGVPTPNLKWLKDGKPITEKPLVDGETQTVQFSNVKPTDAGKYTVEASNPHGKATTAGNLIVQEIKKQYAPVFVERFEEVNVREKGTIKLTAKVKGNPIPSITWFRNNKLLLASPRITEMFDGEQILLEIIDVDSEQDSGNYKCVASNPLGSTTHGARVVVDVPQVSFTKLLPPIVEMDEMSTMRLECETSHTVSATWYHDGKELSGMDNRELVQQGRVQRLVINKASRTDKGVYKCSVNDQSTETQLIVHEVQPDFVRKLEDCEITEQQCAVLEVEISSDTADVVWQKDGMPLESTPGKIEMEKQGTVRKLFIRSTSVHDEGEYSCVLGEQECAAEVTVIELPPEICTHMQDTSVPRGEKACLEIELTKGDALVRWFKDDVELQFSEHVQLSIDGKRQKLKIYQAEESDEGIYSCRVGEQVSTAKLTVQEPPVLFITRLPDVTMIPVGTDAEFIVELSRPDVEVKWFKKGKEMKASDRFIITSEGVKRKLVIKKVTLEDQSDISCMAMNVKTTTKLKIEVIETAPRITVDSKEYKVKRGDDATFTIKYTGTPKPSDEWSVNGTVIKQSKRMSTNVDEESASLTIKKVDDSDCGTYCIKLKNNVGEASASLTLIIIEVPDAPGIPEIVDITNNSVTVHWKEPAFDGNSPITSYILEHHDKEEFLKWHEITSITEKTYKVTDLPKGHEIAFRVSAVNDVGRGKTSDSSKYVKVEAPGSSQAPSFKQPLSDISAGLDKSITLSCVVAGLPEPEVKWFKDGKGFKTKNVSYANNIAKLTIEKITESSGGVYKCKASNSAGTAETTCKLVVQEAPSLKVDEETSSQRLKVAEQWKPVVEFSGFPRPEITWTKDGTSVATDKKIYTDEKTTTLAIYSLDRKDTGTYTITAENSAGKATLDVVLKVIDKPGKPKAINIKDIEAESVNISWEPPSDDGGVDISKYSLEKCEVGKMVWTKVADIERDVRSYTIQRLLTNAEYMFRIFAQNPVGVSEPVESDSVVVKSSFGKPTAPTGPIEVSGMTDSSCIISWEVPSSDGGTPIIDYNVEMREIDQTFWTQVGATKDLQIIISEMKKEKTYEFRVCARNRVGSGPYLTSDEPVVAGRKKTPPSPPKSISVLNIASKSVTLQWEPPVSNGGSELTGYVIEKQPKTSNNWTKVVTLDPNITSYSVENLKEKSEFYFRVFAENIVGLSFPTTTSLVSLKTHATVPSPPTAPLEVRSTGANSVMLAWGVPESDGGAPIEGYKIAVRDIKKTMWMEVGKVSADVHKLTVKDLQENHEYLIRIYARNEVGMSNPLESDEPFKVQRPTAGGEDIDVEEMGLDKDTPSLSFTTTTTQSWMREAGMDPDIHSYARSSLLRRSEYFFRIWYYARHLFK